MINLLFCGNRGVFDGVLTCMLSILKTNRGTEPFCIYLYTMSLPHLREDYVGITEEDAQLLEKTARKYNGENTVRLVDVTELYDREFAGSPNEQCYCSPYTLLRLFADEVEGMPDKLLYLDADLMFQHDIHLLYDIDVTGYEYAAARDHYGKYLIWPNYINAGVLLFNLAHMRETGILGKARNLIRTKHLPFADQSALYRSTTRKKMLPQRFNDQKFLHKSTVVRHFSRRLFYLPYPHIDNIKQWQIDKVHSVFHYHCFDDVYEEYLKIKGE